MCARVSSWFWDKKNRSSPSPWKVPGYFCNTPEGGVKFYYSLTFRKNQLEVFKVKEFKCDGSIYAREIMNLLSRNGEDFMRVVYTYAFYIEQAMNKKGV